MQEKLSPVFVVATANDVTKLPPELLRKGRFDEIFFVDLPNAEERYEIIKIQLKKSAGRAAEKFQHLFDLSEAEIQKVVEASTKKIKDDNPSNPSQMIEVAYTGAEIEQAVIQASYICFEEGKRAMTADDIIKALKATIPLAETMKEEIKGLQAWGNERARNASTKSAKAVSKPSFLGGRNLRPSDSTK
jgi:SpoVK/Ycf46/Vps4 family AAA+-type ATPase